ncbi:esterase/lipase family protein [Aurantiacibacter poecillastricola]|uniref:esterase/lipase family protein n=1 Tax=Aurantiacibacter poecillastricola TaxID=3064385 RepID=UPI00273DB716|nr:alpha/beta fold hydrolase [Aurantiacibacter sp. 219JJ12-13]MDP5261445.1 alpha/beta hydrolase [Aurantiacibacter sp. 219JJ12-13]
MADGRDTSRRIVYAVAALAAGAMAIPPVRRRVLAAANGARHSVKRRVELLKGEAPPDAHAPPLRFFVAELGQLAAPAIRLFKPPLPIEEAAAPKVVILLPGFATHPWRMKYMAKELERAGHIVKRWGLGYNYGPTKENIELLANRVCSVRERYRQNVVLVGWSLGGIFAREVAKMHPNCIAKVITMGTPFSHTPYSNNMWRIYQAVAGHRVEEPPIETNTAEKPPVETVAFWSPRDGAISRRAACGLPGERDRAVALRCTHMGFCNSSEVILALDKELKR